MSWDDVCGQVEPVLVPMEFPCMYGVGGPSLIYPCMPKPKSQTYYCCGQERERSRSRRRSPDRHKHCESYHDDTRPYSPRRHDTDDRISSHRSQGPHSCQSCCETAKPVKNKYVMPCYRCEDGRIHNQPTLLMRRACEVATGQRTRRPLVCSTRADAKAQEHKYAAQDEQDNCCFHFKMKNNVVSSQQQSFPCTNDCPYIPAYPICLHN